MLRNTASQAIGAQMLALDGTAFTGAVTVYVTGDNGTQAAGSVGSGACTHEGNGYHSYAPAQAETNYAHVAFTFIGTGAAPSTVQVYTKTGDAFARLGAPVNASISADIAAVQADTNDIQTRLPAALVSGRMDASVGAMAANVLTATAINADAFTASKFAADVTTELQSGLATAAALATAQTDLDDIQSRLPAALVGGRIDASVGAMANGVQTAASTATDYVAEITAAVPTAAANASAVRTELATELGRVDVAISSRLASAGYTAPDNASIAAILLDTAALDGRVPADPADQSDIAALLDALPTAAETADAVWDEATAGHATAGTFGAAVIAAGSAGDPWSTSLPGAYGAGTAGNIIGNALDAAISTRLAAAGYTAPDNASIAAILADTAALDLRVPASPSTAAAVAAVAAQISALLTTPLSEDYAPRGDEASVAQLLYMLLSLLAERRVVGDQLITGALDASQAMTFLLDDVVSPTEQTRAS